MKPIIEVENLVKRYRNADRNAGDGVSFAVMPSELFALLGPNGAVLNLVVIGAMFGLFLLVGTMLFVRNERNR